MTSPTALSQRWHRQTLSHWKWASTRLVGAQQKTVCQRNLLANLSNPSSCPTPWERSQTLLASTTIGDGKAIHNVPLPVGYRFWYGKNSSVSRMLQYSCMSYYHRNTPTAITAATPICAPQHFALLCLIFAGRHLCTCFATGETPSLKVLRPKTISRLLTQVRRRTVVGKAAVLGDGKVVRRTTSRQTRAATWKIFLGRPPRLVSTGENKKYGTAGVFEDKRRKIVARKNSLSRSVLGSWCFPFEQWKQGNCEATQTSASTVALVASQKSLWRQTWYRYIKWKYLIIQLTNQLIRLRDIACVARDTTKHGICFCRVSFVRAKNWYASFVCMSS